MEFENSHKRGQAHKHSLDQIAYCVRDEVRKMSVGAKYRFVLAAELDTGNTEGYDIEIKPGSVLIYEIELLKIEGRKHS